MVKEINSENFNQEISKGKVLVDIWAPWCGPCRIISPIVDELSNEIKDVKFVKLNVDESPDIASQYEVMGIPTLIMFKDGKEIRRIVGLRSKEEIKKELK